MTSVDSAPQGQSSFSPYEPTYHWRGISFQAYPETVEITCLRVSADEFEEEWPEVPPTIQCAEAILDSEIHAIPDEVWEDGDDRHLADYERGELQ